jgi:hypothetical protein
MDTELQQFAVVARDFCAAVEAVRHLPRSEFLAWIQIALARLYAVVFEIPWIEAETDELERKHRESTFRRLHAALQKDPPDAETAHRFALLDSMEDVLGPVNTFWETNHPTKDRSVDDWSVAEALHDTYESVSRGLRDVEAGARTSEIVDSLKWDFTLDWGRHAVDALRAIHFLMTDYWLQK